MESLIINLLGRFYKILKGAREKGFIKKITSNLLRKMG